MSTPWGRTPRGGPHSAIQPRSKRQGTATRGSARIPRRRGTQAAPRQNRWAQHGVRTTRGPIVDVIHEDRGDLVGHRSLHRPLRPGLLPPGWLTFGKVHWPFRTTRRHRRPGPIVGRTEHGHHPGAHRGEVTAHRRRGTVPRRNRMLERCQPGAQGRGRFGDEGALITVAEARDSLT
jgi:hypothetical protein